MDNQTLENLFLIHMEGKPYAKNQQVYWGKDSGTLFTIIDIQISDISIADKPNIWWCNSYYLIQDSKANKHLVDLIDAHLTCGGQLAPFSQSVFEDGKYSFKRGLTCPYRKTDRDYTCWQSGFAEGDYLAREVRLVASEKHSHQLAQSARMDRTGQ